MGTLRTTLSILTTTLVLTASAQNSNVVNAYNYMKDGDLARAAEYIEPAIMNETTMGCLLYTSPSPRDRG